MGWIDLTMTEVEGTYLVTTSIQTTQPTFGSIDLLGSWCDDATKVGDNKVESRVVPYHWDDRQRLYRDYLYLQHLHEELLDELRDQLNDCHGVKRSKRYWRIILGPWLNWALPVLLDRWISIDEYRTSKGPLKTIVLTGTTSNKPPNDMAEFMSLVDDPYWNHCLYAELVGRRPEIELLVGPWPDLDPVVPGVTINEVAPTFYQRLWGRLEKMAAQVTSRDKIVLFSTYLSRREEMLLCLRLRQLPITRSTMPVPEVDWQPEVRDWVLAGPSCSPFEEWIRGWIPKHLPRAYLEGYSEVIRCTKMMNWPTSPDLIWTSIAFNSDEVFKMWAAECVEMGTSLVIGQHGGFNGLGKWSSAEDHEISISDRYLSWGWTDGNDERVSPVGVLRPKTWLELDDREPCNALMVLGAGPRQAYRMQAIPVAGQWSDYFDNQCRFIEALPEEVRACLVVRPDRSYLGRNGRDQIIERTPEVIIDDGSENIREQFRKTKLHISTYHGSSILEALVMNIPSVLCLDPSLFEFRDSAITARNQLRDVGIYHDSIESAVDHISNIWRDIEGWWGLNSVQSARNEFLECYARRPTDLLTEIEMVLRDSIVRNTR